jgi:hypothetical protein
MALAAGAAEVDRIHDMAFVGSQVEHFKKTYALPEHVASLMRDEYGDSYTLDPPTDIFFLARQTCADGHHSRGAARRGYRDL